MNSYANLEILCNVMYKKDLDSYNQEPTRKEIIDFFKSEFSDVWLTQYDDIIVCCDISNQSVFISQLGFFRYKDLKTGEYISLSEYREKEWLSFSIVLDMYLDKNETRSILSNSNFELIPLINLDEHGKVVGLSDKTLSTEFLNKLFERSSIFLSMINSANLCFDNFFS